MQRREGVFAALADPTRRSIVELLVDGGPATATRLSDHLGISRQAVAKHLDRLAETGLAISRHVGRETRYEARLDPLDDVTGWVRDVEGLWARRLEALRAALADTDNGRVRPRNRLRATALPPPTRETPTEPRKNDATPGAASAVKSDTTKECRE